MNQAKWRLGLFLGGVILIGITFAYMDDNPIANPIPIEIGEEAELAIPVIWNDFPEGVLLRAERSEWEVYARGERSIVVYDFRAEMMAPKQSMFAMQLELALVDEERQTIKTHELEVSVDSLYKEGDLMALNWRWQDTLQNPLNPAKLLVKNISTNWGTFQEKSLINVPIQARWQAEKPKQVDLKFEIRHLDYIKLQQEDRNPFAIVVATTNTGTLDLEFLQLRIDAVAQDDSLLFSIQKDAIESHDVPLRVGFTRICRALFDKGKRTFETKDISQLKVTILEADY